MVGVHEMRQGLTQISWSLCLVPSLLLLRAVRQILRKAMPGDGKKAAFGHATPLHSKALSQCKIDVGLR